MRGSSILRTLKRGIPRILKRKRLTLGGRVFNAVGGVPGGLLDVYRAARRYEIAKRLGVPWDTAHLISELDLLAGFETRRALYKALRGKDPNRLWLLKAFLTNAGADTAGTLAYRMAARFLL